MPATTKEAPTQAFSTRIDIPAKDRGPLIELINQQLAKMTNLKSAVDDRPINCATCHRGAIDPHLRR